LRLAAEFCKRFMPEAAIYLPSVTWQTHFGIFQDAGIETETYSYLDSTGLGLDFEGMLTDLYNCPEGSVVLLHMCAHNPTGIDPSEQQWRDILEVIRYCIRLCERISTNRMVTCSCYHHACV
jgi:aspartate/tyrosine/aromatic aminotransferase